MSTKNLDSRYSSLLYSTPVLNVVLSKNDNNACSKYYLNMRKISFIKVLKAKKAIKKHKGKNRLRRRVCKLKFARQTRLIDKLKKLSTRKHLKHILNKYSEASK